MVDAKQQQDGGIAPAALTSLSLTTNALHCTVRVSVLQLGSLDSACPAGHENDMTSMRGPVYFCARHT